jgi:coproporphyrinogen III oxidase
MSLPPEVKWRYGAAPEPGSPEALSLEAICAQRDWAEESESLGAPNNCS